MSAGSRWSRIVSCCAATLWLAACQQSVPVHTTPESRRAPTESIVLHVPLAETDAVHMLHRTIFQAGLLASSQHRTERWVQVDLGGEWADTHVLRQWMVFVRYDEAPWGGTVFSMRAMERNTTFLVDEGIRQRSGGFSRLVPVSNQSQGLSHQAWQRLEQIARGLVEAGGEPLGGFGPQTAVVEAAVKRE